MKNITSTNFENKEVTVTSIGDTFKEFFDLELFDIMIASQIKCRSYKLNNI